MKPSPVSSFLGLALFLGFSCTPAQGVPPARPNFIFILADDLGVMDVGAFNPKTFYETPVIDGIAKNGMRFMNGYAACSVCSPTRSSIMTGKYPPRTGMTDHTGGSRAGKLLPARHEVNLALEEYTVAEALRDAGYATFFAGKWHLGTGAYGPGAQGFDSDLATSKGDYFPPDCAETDPKSDPKSTDRIADAAVRFIGEHKARPFFAYLPFNAVHIPMGARPALVEKYTAKAATAQADAWGAEGDCRVRLVQNNPVYAAVLEQMDTAIGRVLAAVEENGLAGRTVVIFMSDNGGLSTAEGHVTSNLPLRAGKGWLYEAGVREPLIVLAPGLTQPGSTCDTPVTSNDFYPTMLELAGLPLNPAQHRDGMSLVPLLKGAPLERGPLFWHYPHYSNQGGAPAGAMRDGNWKLLEWYEDGRIELFNLHDDPREKSNLAVAQPERAARMRDRLAAWRKEVGARMPAPNPEYVPGQQPAARKKPKK